MKAKPCSAPGCNRPQWGGKFCDRHQALRKDKPPPKGLKKTEMKRTSRLRPISKDLLSDLSRYRALREKFLTDHPRCAVYPWKEATQVHHKKGRGRYLNDTSTWLAVSHEGHRKIEENPEWAYEQGFSLKRNAK